MRAALTTTAEHLVPSIEHLLTERVESGQAARVPKVPIEALEGCCQVPLVHQNAVMPAGFQRLFHFLEEFPAVFLRRPPLELPPILPGAGSEVGHTEEVEGHPGLMTRLCGYPCAAAKGQAPRFLGRQFQTKLMHTHGQLRRKALCILRLLKADEKIIGKSYKVRFAAAGGLHHLLKPQIQHIMKVDVTQQRRNRSALCKVNENAK